MARGRAWRRRLVAALLALCLIPALVLGVLVWSGHLESPAALAAFAAIALLTALPLTLHLRHIDALNHAARAMVAHERPVWPESEGTAGTDETLALLKQIDREWSERARRSDTLLGSYETMVDNLPDPLLMLDEERLVVRANQAARSLFGRDPAGRDLAAVLREPTLLEAAEDVLNGEPGRDLEFSLPVPLERTFRARLAPLPAKGVDDAVVVVALHDVTGLKRVERMRADFVANASHELRTPLSAVLGYIETLRGPARDDAEARERFLGIMFEQASRMARLVEELLSLSRIELNEHTQPRGRADVGRILSGVAETLDLPLKAKTMRFVLSVPDDLPAVRGEEDELAQVFQNLMDNAVKYGAAGTPVEVRAERLETPPPVMPRAGGPVVRVSVRDHGEGIPKEHIPRLTERFYRVDSARSRKLGGTGLGLAIVKHLVNRHRGALVIESTPGEGSVFSVYLPTAD